MIFRCLRKEFSIQYLGVSLSPRALVKADWWPLIERMEKKLQGWKVSALSVGGKLVLLNVALSATPTYIMLFFKIPHLVLKKLERIRRNFLWIGGANKKPCCMVRWDVVCHPMDLGGLGVRNLKMWNEALMAKW